VGLGLTICKKITESMGGAITISSEVNKGSTFTIYIELKIPDDELHLDTSIIDDEETVPLFHFSDALFAEPIIPTSGRL
jgi:signal transduction histidine kinase